MIITCREFTCNGGYTPARSAEEIATQFSMKVANILSRKCALASIENGVFHFVRLNDRATEIAGVQTTEVQLQSLISYYDKGNTAYFQMKLRSNCQKRPLIANFSETHSLFKLIDTFTFSTVLRPVSANDTDTE